MLKKIGILLCCWMILSLVSLTTAQAPTPPLDGTFTTPDGALTLQHPSVWDVTAFDGVIFMTPDPADSLTLVLMPADADFYFDLDLPDEPTLNDVAILFSQGLLELARENPEGTGNMAFSSLQSTPFGPHSGVILRGGTGIPNSRNEVVFIGVLNVDGDLWIANVSGAMPAIDLYQPIFEAVLSTIESSVMDMASLSLAPINPQNAAELAPLSALQTEDFLLSSRDIAFTPDGERLVYNDGNAIVVVDTTDFSILETLTGEFAEQSVYDIHISADGQRVAAAFGDPFSTDGGVQVWELRTGDTLMVTDVTSNAQSITFTPDGEQVVAGNWRGELYVIEVASSGVLQSFDFGDDGSLITEVAFIREGELFVVGESMTDTVFIVSLATGSVDARPLFDTFADLSITGDQTFIGLAGEGNSNAPALVILNDGSMFRTIETMDSATAISFSPDGGLVAVAGSDGVLRIVDNGTGAEVHSFMWDDANETELGALAFSPDGRILVAYFNDATVRFYGIPQ